MTGLQNQDRCPLCHHWSVCSDIIPHSICKYFGISDSEKTFYKGTSGCLGTLLKLEWNNLLIVTTWSLEVQDRDTDST